MDLLGPGLFQAGDAGLARGAADDRVVHDDDALPAHEVADEVELHPDVEVPDELRRLEETPADVMVPHEGHLERDAALQRVAERGGVPAVGHGHHDIGLDGMLAGELAAHLDAHLVHVAVGDVRVGPGEVHVLEHAERAPRVLGERLHRAQSVRVDDHDLARLHVADELRLDQVQRAGLARQHEPSVGQPADAQRTEAVRVAHADELVLGEDDQGICALDAAHGLDQSALVAARLRRLGEQVDDDLGIHRRLEDGALGLQLVAQGGGVGEVAVVADGDLALGAIDGQRLGVGQVRRPGRRVARVADGRGADQLVEHVAVEDVRHQPHALVDVELLAVGRDDAGRFLAAVLELVEPVVGELGGVRMAVDAEHAAVVLRIMLHVGGD